MALSPGGGRSPSAQPPPTPARTTGPRPARPGGKPRWPHSATVSVLRLGLLIGGLVIIADLGATAIVERTVINEDVQAVLDVDEILNYVLFSLLGVLVVRDTGIMYAGAVAGVLAGLLDAIVVTAASLMVPPPPPMEVLALGFARNLIIGTVFAGLSGVVFALVQRWSGGQRSR
jgi:hypothetical protein